MNNPAQTQSTSSSADSAVIDSETLLTEVQAAELLQVTPRAVQKWRAEGTGPRFIRISGRCVRYRRRDLIEWTEARLKSSTAE